MRLDRFLAERSAGSRKQVKELIAKGRVTVNGEVVCRPEYQVAEADLVAADGETISAEAYEYWLLYKPAGYLSAAADKTKPVVTELVPSARKDLAPVGRLDLDTEGLLLVTNDGALSHRLLSPKYHVEKCYYAELDADLPPDAAARFSESMVFSDFTAKPAVSFEQVSDRKALLAITEGKYHQVKRMFGKLGCEVVYLRRERFGPLSLVGMKKGEARQLTEAEIHLLKEASER